MTQPSVFQAALNSNGQKGASRTEEERSDLTGGSKWGASSGL